MMRRRRQTPELLELVVARLATMAARMLLDPHTSITKI